MSVEFVDELPAQSVANWKTLRMQAFADALRESPGRWGKLPFPPANRKAGHSKAYQIRCGEYKAFPGAGWEAKYREGAVYVRYMGGAA